MEQENSGNEVLQIDVLSGGNQLGDALQNCMCLFSILSELGDDVNNVSKDFCIKEEGGSGISCSSACLKENNTCFPERCSDDVSTHVDVCTMYQNQKRNGFDNSFHIIIINLDCKTASQHLKSTCLNVLCKNTK